MYLLETQTLTTSILDKIDAKFIRTSMGQWRVLAFAWLFLLLRDLSEISRGVGVGILNLGSEMR